MEKTLEDMNIIEIQSLLCIQYEELNRVQTNIQILQKRREELKKLEKPVEPIKEN